MSYFKKFPFINRYKIQNKTFTAQDITRRTALLNESRNNPNAYTEYLIKDGESAHIISDRIYDTVDLYWVILMFNNIFDESSQWPLDHLSLDTYIKRMYENPNGLHHYVSAMTGSVVCRDHPEYDKVPITNYEHELNINEEKRRVKIPIPSVARQIVSEHNRLVAL